MSTASVVDGASFGVMATTISFRTASWRLLYRLRSLAHGTVIQDMKQRLVLFAELACRVLPFVPEVEIGIVWQHVHCCIEGELHLLLGQ